MQQIEIAIPDLNDSYSRVVLDKVQYLLRMSWNETGQYWYFGLHKPDKTPILQGIKVVPRFPLNLGYVDDDIPFGLLCVYSDKERIGRYDFIDGTAIFAYIPAIQEAGV